MARALRIEYPGAWYHITSRGNNAQPIFHDNADRAAFIRILEESIMAFTVELHGYVLMRNHFHLILQTPLGNLCRFMQRLNTAFTVFFNWKQNRVGHLFQGRYKGILIDSDSYLLELSRYIHLNPVHTQKMANETFENKLQFLESYPWSSYLAYTGRIPIPNILRTHLILGKFGNSIGKACRGYRLFVLEGLKDDTPDPLKGRRHGVILGDESFVRWVYRSFVDGKEADKELSNLRASLPPITLEHIAQCVADEFKVAPQEILGRKSRHTYARRVLLELCRRYLTSHKRMNEIGAMVGGITGAAIVMNKKRLSMELKNSKALSRRFERVKDNVLS
jgi:REP element-mobilizing transposase RayT